MRRRWRWKRRLSQKACSRPLLGRFCQGLLPQANVYFKAKLVMHCYSIPRLAALCLRPFLVVVR